MNTITVTIVKTHTLVRAIADGKTLPLPEGTTNVNASEVLRGVLPFDEFTYAYVGSKETGTVIVEQIKRDEPWEAAGDRLKAAVAKFEQ